MQLVPCWEKKFVSSPTPSNNSVLALLKDVVHTPDMQHHLRKLCINYSLIMI